MFPSLFIRPETSYLTVLVGYGLFGFGFFLSQFKKIALVAVVVSLLLLPQSSQAFMAGGCGTACMASQSQWPSPWGGGGFHGYPYMVSPIPFWANPVNFWPQLPPWGPHCWNCSLGWSHSPGVVY